METDSTRPLQRNPARTAWIQSLIIAAVIESILCYIAYENMSGIGIGGLLFVLPGVILVGLGVLAFQGLPAYITSVNQIGFYFTAIIVFILNTLFLAKIVFAIIRPHPRISI